MKKAKITHVNQNKQLTEEKESYSLKDLIKIIIVLVLVFAIFYFITTLVVKTSNSYSNKNNSITQFDSTKITLNSLLNRSENEYYVIATKESLYNNFVSQVNYVEIYNKYLEDYSLNEESLTVYRVNLDDALNKNYIGDNTNITNDLTEMKLSDEVLFKIKNAKIEEYYVGNEEIIKALSNLK